MTAPSLVGMAEVKPVGRTLEVTLPRPSPDLSKRSASGAPGAGGRQRDDADCAPTRFERGGLPRWLSGRSTGVSPAGSPGSLTYILGRILGAGVDKGAEWSQRDFTGGASSQESACQCRR